MTTTRSEIALGTVQWGMAYGIANHTGQATESDVAAMLDLAQRAGVDTLDTARAYGSAEAVIGRSRGRELGFRVVTKLSPSVCEREGHVREATEESLRSSREALQVERLDVVLLHRPEHRLAAGGAAWRSLLSARDAGMIGAIGVSATSPETAVEALGDADVAVMQVAASLLDRRLERCGFFEDAALRDVEVHVRSAFLQGLAFIAPESLPAHLSEARACLEAIDVWAKARQVSRATVFLAYAFSLPVARIVMGCERPEQLRTNLESVARARSLADEVKELSEDLPALPSHVLNPAEWPASN